MAEIKTVNDLKREISDLNTYSWDLYFFQKDKDNNYEFFTSNMVSDFKNYIDDLIIYKTKNIEREVKSIAVYTGDNLKTSCDKIKNDNELIKDVYEKFSTSINEISDKNLKTKDINLNELIEQKAIYGYVMVGNKNQRKIILIKKGSPKMRISANLFRINNNQDIDFLPKNSVYQLAYDFNCFILDEYIYSFNGALEDIFNLEKSLKIQGNKIKQKIIDLNIFSNTIPKKDLEKYIKNNHCNRTLLKFSDKMASDIMDINNRELIAKNIGLDLDANKDIIIDSDEKALLLIKFLCLEKMRDILNHDTYDVYQAKKVN